MSARLLILCVVVLLVLLSPQKVFASSFAQTSLQLDRLAPHAPLSATVCATSSSPAAGIEAKIAITFPTDFVLSTQPTDWSTSTTSLPSGTTAWPGIGSQASTVSGSTVTFASSDLNANSQYCFTLSASNSTTGNLGQKMGVIATRTSGNVVIDQKDYAVAITNDQVTISGTVPAKSTDFITSLRSLAPNSVHQDSIITYELTYGSELSYPLPLTLEAEWSQGTIAESSTPSVDIVDYVIGSADPGINGTPPVVDLVNRKITWTISSFPASTTHTLTFQLQTGNSYTGKNAITFTVAGRILGPGTASLDSTVTQSYTYELGPTATPKPTLPLSVTPTPSAPSKPPQFTDLSLSTLTNSTAVIKVQTNDPTTLTLRYGTQMRQLTSSLTSLQRGLSHTLELTNLTPQTTYYFTITATSASGDRRTSDIFTFTTADSAELPHIDTNSLIFVSNNIILSNSQGTGKPRDFLVLPKRSILEVKLAVNKPQEIRSIQLLLQNSHVLGAHTFVNDADAVSVNTNLVSLEHNQFIGRLSTNQTPDLYDLVARVQDTHGNVIEQKLISLRVTPYLSVFTTKQQPVQKARVFLSYYNADTRIYAPLSLQGVAIDNPSFSDEQGIVPITLPSGKYKAEVSALGYDTTTTFFTLGETSSDTYPQITLEARPFSLTMFFHQGVDKFTDALTSLVELISQGSVSYELSHLTKQLILLLFVLLSLLTFYAKTHFHLRSTPAYLSLLWRSLRGQQTKRTQIIGYLTDETSQLPISQANVILLASSSDTILATVKTDKQGRFVLTLPQSPFRIQLLKEGYEERTLSEIHPATLDTSEITISLSNTGRQTKHRFITHLIEELLGFLFETCLCLSLLLEIFAGIQEGFVFVLPYLFISGCNILLWISYKNARALA